MTISTTQAVMNLTRNQRDAAGAAHATWEASGARTRARLADLVEHFARVYGCAADAATIEGAITSSIPEWQWD